MTPRFADAIAWQQAELLMQPIFIRVIDNLGKQLERSPWKGTYRDMPIWAEGVPNEVKVKVTQLQQQLKQAAPEQLAEIEQTLAHLPQASPGYELCLEYKKQQINLNLWDLCYRICFDHYNPETQSSGDEPVVIATDLIDETGDVDWQQLDHKAKQIIEQIFAELPLLGAS
jgi:hypothetical protein